MTQLVLKKFFRFFTVILTLAVMMSEAKAQTAAQYAFAASTGTFTPLSGGTTVPIILADDALSAPLPIGFTFIFGGVGYANVVAGSNGYLSFSTTAATATATQMRTNSFVTANPVIPIVAAIWDDLDGNPAFIDPLTPPQASYLTTGLPGNRIFTFEQLNTIYFVGSGVNTAQISFQIKLYEANGKVEFIYRKEAGTGVPASASIGIATAAGTYLSLNNATSTATASSTTNTTAITTYPATGQIYSFTPPPPCTAPTAQPTAFSFTATTSSINASFTAASPAPTKYLIVRTPGVAALNTTPVDGTAYAVGSALGNGTVIGAQAATTLNTTSLPGGTQYTYTIFSYNDGCVGGGGPGYFTTSPLTGLASTSSCANTLGGVKTIPGDYATLTAAIADISATGLGSAITLSLGSGYSSAGETFPITINQFGCSNPTASNTITIKPATGATPTISGAVASGVVLRILSSYVIVDGSNTAAGTTRDLTITNTSVTTPTVIGLGSSGTTPLVQTVIKNTNIVNGVNTSTAVLFADATSTAATVVPGYFNNITFQNNSIKRAYIGIYNLGVVAAGNGTGINISSNDLNTVGADAIRFVGVYVQGFDGVTVANNNIGNFDAAVGEIDRGVWLATGTTNTTVSGNNISNLGNNAAGAFSPIGINVTPAVAASGIVVSGNTISSLSSTGTVATGGIVLSGATEGVTIEKNKITNIKNLNGAGAGAYGVQLASTSATANSTVTNNFISDIAGYGSATLANNGHGIYISTGGGYGVYFNSVSLTTNQTNTVGISAPLTVASGVAATAALNIRNNIFANTQTVGFPYAIYSGAANTVYSAVDYNDYWSAGTNLGFLGSNLANLAAVQTGFGGNLNSINVLPVFNTSSDLHLVASNPAINNAGVTIAGIVTDIDGNTRGATPDIGADEFISYTSDAGVIAAASACPGLQNVQVTIKNYGQTVLNTVNVTWSVNSVAQTTANLTALNLAPGATTVVTIGTFAFVPTTSYSITAATALPNGAADPNAANDAYTTILVPALSGTYTVGAAGTYTTLTAAVAAYNTYGTCGSVIFDLIDATYGASETFPIVINSVPTASATNTLTIRPQTGMASVQINSANVTSTIDLSGARYVTFDGRPGGTGTSKGLAIINTATAGAAIRIINDASNNTLTYCDLMGQNTSSTSSATVATGVVYIGGTTTPALLGNDNNTISNCDIHGTTTGTPNIGISAMGIITNPASYNDNNTVTNCNIYDFFSATLASTGIKAEAGNSAWTITNNSVYQTVSRTYTTAATHRGFWITPNTASLAPQASGFVITGNYIGGTAPLAGGTPYTMLGAIANIFNGMDLSVGLGAATSVQNNTIANLALTSTSTGNVFVGIGQANGHMNIGTVTGNTIGSGTGTGSIVLNSTGSAAITFGIRIGAGTLVTVNANNNIVGGITVNSSTTISNSIIGIGVMGGSGTYTINNNTVGSTTTANSIMEASASTAATGQNVQGIAIATTSTPVTATVSNNTIANLTNAYNGTTTSQIMGINIAGGTSVPLITVSGNTMFNFTNSSLSTGAGATAALLGISLTTTTGGATVSGNTIFGMSSTAPAAAVNLVGMYLSAPTSGANVVSRNFIHSFAATSTSATATMTGIDVAAGASTFSNNMIRLGVDGSGNSVSNNMIVRGISQGTTAANNYYFNSVYVGGTVGIAATANSFAFHKNAAIASGTENIKNNIFSNARSNGAAGAGKHYATYLLTSGANVALSNNLYYAPGTGGVMGWNGTADVAAYTAGWVAGDINSFLINPNFINPTGTSASVDLHINPAISNPAESGALTIAGITQDFDGATRNAATPDIGADEFIGTTPAPALSSITLTPPLPQCVATARTVNTVITSTLPVTSVTLNYNNGAAGSVPMTLASGTSTNGTWSGVIPAASPANTTVTWGIVATDGTYTTNATGTSYKDAYLTNATTVASASSGTICSGNSSTLSVVTQDGQPGFVNIGTQTTTVAGADGNPYRTSSATTVKVQMLVLASELSVQGLLAGNITSIALTATAAASFVSNFTINMALTSATSLTTTFLTPAMTPVFTQTTFTPAIGVNTHVFSTPFVWDGVSNVLIDMCQSNTGAGTTTIAAFTPSYTSCVTSITACNAATGATTATRPIMRFGGTVGANITPGFTWSWLPGPLSGSSVTVTPNATTSYTATGIDANGCSVTSNAVTVNVTPAVSVTTQPPASLALCAGSTLNLSIVATNATAYQWYNGATALVNGVDISGATSANLSITNVSAANTGNYTVVVTGTAPCNPVTSNITSVTVNPVLANNTISAAQTICSGAIPAALTGTTPTGGNGTTYVYLWESSTVSATTGFATATGISNTSGYTPGALTGTTWYRRTVTSGGCTNTSAAIEITVSPVLANNSISAAQAICSGATPAALTGTTPTGGNGITYVYLWESSTVSASAGFATATGTSNASGYTPGALTVNTWYRRTVTSGGCTNTSAAIAITITPAVANNTVSALQTICSGSTPAALTGTTPTGGNGGPYTYLWESSTVSASTGFATATGTSNASGYAPGPLTTTTWYRRTATGGCSNTSAAIQITVTPLATTIPSTGTTATNVQTDGTINTYSASGSCNPIAMIVDAAGGTAPGSTSASVVIDPSVQTVAGQKYLQRHYTIAPTVNGPATLTLYATQAEMTAFNAAPGSFPAMPTTGNNSDPNKANIRVSKFPGSTPFVAPGQLITPTTVNWNGNYWEITFPVTTFSTFYIHTGTLGPLDIELRDISAVNIGKRNRVDWSTVGETNADKFELERSVDGENFTYMGTVAVKGQSSIYSYWDENPISGLNHYRLKMFSKDGEFKYSKNVTAFVKGNGAFVVEAFPNPVEDKLTVRVNGIPGNNATIVLTDVSGKLIKEIPVTGVEIGVDMGGLAQGMYFIKYFDNNHSQIIKINKR